MTITVEDLKREVRIKNLKEAIANNGAQRSMLSDRIATQMTELAGLLGMDVCGEALVEKQVQA